MKNLLKIAALCAAFFISAVTVAQTDTTRYGSPDRDPNPGKIMHDTSRIRNNDLEIRRRTNQKPATPPPKKQPDDGRIVQPGDTLGRYKNPGTIKNQ